MQIFKINKKFIKSKNTFSTSSSHEIPTTTSTRNEFYKTKKAFVVFNDPLAVHIICDLHSNTAGGSLFSSTRILAGHKLQIQTAAEPNNMICKFNFLESA